MSITGRKFNIFGALKDNQSQYLSEEELEAMRIAGYTPEEIEQQAGEQALQERTERKDQVIRTVGGIPQTLVQGIIDFSHTVNDLTAEAVVSGVDPITGAAIQFDPSFTKERKEETEKFLKEKSQKGVDRSQEVLAGLYATVVGNQNVEMVERDGHLVAAFKRPEGTALNLTRGIGTFAAEFVGLNKLLGPTKAKTYLGKAGTIALRGEAVAQVAINPYEANLANILGSYIGNLEVSDKEGILADINNLLYSYREPLEKTLPTLEKFAYEKGDSALEARSKLLFEGLVLTLGVESVIGSAILGTRGLKSITKDSKAYADLPSTGLKPKKTQKEKSYYIDNDGKKIYVDMPTPSQAFKQIKDQTLEEWKKGFTRILQNISKDENKIKDFMSALQNSFKISSREKGSSLYETIRRRRREEIEAGNVKGWGDMSDVRNLFGLVKSRYQGNNYAALNWLGRTRDYMFSTKASGIPDQLFRSAQVKEGRIAEWLKIIEFNSRDLESSMEVLFGFIGKGRKPMLTKVNNILDADYRLTDDAKYLLAGRTIRRKNKYQQTKFLESLKDLPEVLREPIRKIRATQDALTEAAIRNGNLTKEEVREFRGQLGSYMRTSYEAYEKSAFYPSRNSEQVLRQELRTYYIKNFPKEATDPATGKQFIKDKISQDIDTILNKDGDTLRSLFKTIEGYKKTETITAKKKLKSRTIKNFLGEIKDPVDRALLSGAKIARYTEDIKFFNRVHELGKGIWLFDPEKTIINPVTKATTKAPIPRGFRSVIPDGHGPLSGMHTTPEINRFIQGLNEGQVMQTRDRGNKPWNVIINGMHRYGAYNAFLKYEATVGSIASAYKNFFGSGTMTTQQGINPFSKEFAEGLALVGHEFVRGTNKQKQEIIQLMARQGFLGKTVEITDIEGALHELGKIQKGRYSVDRVMEVLAKYEISIPVLRKKNGDFYWGRDQVSINKILSKGGESYRGGDEAWKMGVFLHQTKYYQKVQDALPKNDPKAQKYIKDPVEQAADAVERSLQNYDRISTFGKQLKSIPRVGKFYSFNSESFRIFLTTFKTLFEEGVLWRNMKKDGFDEAANLVRNRAIKRAVGFASTNIAWSPKVHTAILGGYLYYKKGDKEDQQQKAIEAFKALGPEWYKEANLTVIRNDKGEPVVIDLSSWNPEQYPIDFLTPFIVRALSVDPLVYNEAETMKEVFTAMITKQVDPWLGPDLASAVLAPFLDVDQQGYTINSVGKQVPISAEQDRSWTYHHETGATYAENFFNNFPLLMNNVFYKAMPRTLSQAIKLYKDKNVAELEGEEYSTALALLKLITGMGGLTGNESFIENSLNTKITYYKNRKSELVQDLRRSIKTTKTTDDFKKKFLDVNMDLLVEQRNLIKAFAGANYIAKNYNDSDTQRENLALRSKILEIMQESGLSEKDRLPIAAGLFAQTAFFQPISLEDEQEDTTLTRMLGTAGQQKEGAFAMYRNIIQEMQMELGQIPIYTELEKIEYDRDYFAEKKEQLEEKERNKKFTGGAISEDFPVPNVSFVPSERVDKNAQTGLSYEAPFKPPTLLSEALKERKAKQEGGEITIDPLSRLGFKGGGLMNGVEDPLARLGFTGGGGLMVSIGVAPVSEKQMSKFEKALKKRKAKREGGRIGFNYGGDDQDYSNPVLGLDERAKEYEEAWRPDVGDRDPQADPFQNLSAEAAQDWEMEHGAQIVSNYRDAQIAGDVAADDDDNNILQAVAPVTELSAYETNYNYFLPLWNSAVATNAKLSNAIQGGYENMGRITKRLIKNRTTSIFNKDDNYYILPGLNPNTTEEWGSEDEKRDWISQSVESGTIAGYSNPEEAEIDREEMFEQLVSREDLDQPRDNKEAEPEPEPNQTKEEHRGGGASGGLFRNYKKEYANYQSQPEQKKNRAGRNAARRSLLRTGRVNKGDGKDVDHRDGNPRNNSPSNLLVKPKSSNRSFSRRLKARNGGLLDRQQYGRGDKVLQGIKHTLSKILIGADKKDIDDLDQRTIDALINNIDKIESPRERQAIVEDIKRYKDGTPISNLISPGFNTLRHAKVSYEFGDKRPFARPALIAKEQAQSKGLFYKKKFKADLKEAESRAEKIDALNNVKAFRMKDKNPNLNEEEFNEEFFKQFNESAKTSTENLKPGEHFYLRESDAIGVDMPSIGGQYPFPVRNFE